jgi:hypothetical protein
MDNQTTPNNTPSPKNPGCLIPALLIGIALLGFGIHLLNDWEHIGGASKAGAVVLIVLGTLAVLPFLLLQVVKLVLKIWLARAFKGIAGSMGGLIENNKKLFDSLHKYRDAAEADFFHLDRDQYESTTRWFEAGGYRVLGDMVNSTIEELSNVTTVYRIMVSEDGLTEAGMYHFPKPMPSMGDRPIFIVDLDTEFSDGTFLVTSNTKETDLLTPPPQLRRNRLPLDTSLATLVDEHKSAVAQRLAETPGLTCQKVNNLAESMNREHRQQQIKIDFRASIGHLDPEELRRSAEAMNLDPQFQDAAVEAAKIAQAQKKQDNPPNSKP